MWSHDSGGAPGRECKEVGCAAKCPKVHGKRLPITTKDHLVQSVKVTRSRNPDLKDVGRVTSSREEEKKESSDVAVAGAQEENQELRNVDDKMQEVGE